MSCDVRLEMLERGSVEMGRLVMTVVFDTIESIVIKVIVYQMA